ncbi:hypothetical protein Nizo2259_2417 [Lactiplantibacillus plantarum]|uniref:Uncharacterized protein n=1 Tax=Lactiplantibacillus plantarum TaxID=1590 RepID=A0A165R2K8_LACPN|nr:hypothetical protein Nizo2259_2417 [Lactiplantibacillus plantarum]KZU35328.1 hypothetical protein Nizo2535_0155 [Lactiplantibacillus plantarum]KZU79455.1 hypothetical protein Nizo2891_1206 [Lactiplantibacillus plantarum]KZU91914.1 hypothetical protein Lp19_3200 [Lactiplantibacillus plantarum]CDN27901.1 hypothetical protein predicted by Glimmer/Critica [Lactiplantibacillus plantarum]
MAILTSAVECRCAVTVNQKTERRNVKIPGAQFFWLTTQSATLTLIATSPRLQSS